MKITIDRSEPVAWKYVHVQSGYEDIRLESPEQMSEWNHIENWHVTPLYAGTAPQRVALCLWTQDPDFEMGDTYASDCGEVWSFINGGPEENRVRFCHGCGKPVEVVRNGIGEHK